MSQKIKKIVIIICVVLAAVLGVYHGTLIHRAHKLRTLANEVCVTQYQDMLTSLYDDTTDELSDEVAVFLKSKQGVFCKCYSDLIVDNASDYDGLSDETLIKIMVLDYAGYTYQCLDTFGPIEDL